MSCYRYYDLNEIAIAKKKLEDINKTAAKKSMHYEKVEQLRKYLINIGMPINRWLFDPEFVNGFSDYNDAVNIFYEVNTKENLDNKLRYVIKNIKKELQCCVNTEYEFKESIIH